jgi:hypothetical protein
MSVVMQMKVNFVDKAKYFRASLLTSADTEVLFYGEQKSFPK